MPAPRSGACTRRTPAAATSPSVWSTRVPHLQSSNPVLRSSLPVRPSRPCSLHLGPVERLRKALKAAKKAPRGLSVAAGLSPPTAANIESGGDMPAIDTVEHLARALGVAPCWLAFGVLGERTF